LKADWLTFEGALRTVLESVAPLTVEDVPLISARGRVLADSIVSPFDLPRWTNSAMDGFAVRADDIRGASREEPVSLRIVEEVAAGGFPARAISTGEATRVMTGAPIPVGADSVVRIEMTDGGNAGSAERRVAILSDEDAGRNVRFKGEELHDGDVAVAAGAIASPGVIGMAAALGYRSLRVVRRPRVALLASGDELVDLNRFDEVVEGRKIVSSNSYTLAAQLADAGCEVVDLGIAADSRESLQEAVLRADGCDALITSAGISVGEHDYVKDVLADLDTDVAFWRVRIRPGSPFAFGRIGGLGGMPWFGLPGNPVSSAVTFEVLARPALLRMAGHARPCRGRIRARLVNDVASLPTTAQLIRVTLRRDVDGGWEAEPTGAQGSGLLSSFAKADGLLVVPEGGGQFTAGEHLEVIPFESAWMDQPFEAAGR
jgi:molybdopterin molybdotransferase